MYFTKDSIHLSLIERVMVIAVCNRLKFVDIHNRLRLSGSSLSSSSRELQRQADSTVI